MPGLGFFPLSLSPCSVCSAHSSTSVQSHHCTLGLARGWGGSAPSHRDGWLFLEARGRSPSASQDTWHQSGSQGAFLSSGAIPAPCTGNTEPKPALSPPKGAAVPLKTLLPSFPLPSLLCQPEKPIQTWPPQALCPPASLLPPCSLPPLSLCDPPEPWGCFPQTLPLQLQLQDWALCLGLLWAAATKIPDPAPYPGTLLSSVPSLSSLSQTLLTDSLALHCSMCFSLHKSPPRPLPTGCRRADGAVWNSHCRKQAKKGEGTKIKILKQGKCTYTK